jgi:hypothetical protein
MKTDCANEEFGSLEHINVSEGKDKYEVFTNMLKESLVPESTRRFLSNCRFIRF